MMKKTVLLLSLLLLVLLPLFSYEVQVGEGYRTTETGGFPYFTTVSYSEKTWDMTFSFLDGHDVLWDSNYRRDLSPSFFLETGDVLGVIDWSTVYALADVGVGYEKTFGPLSLSLMGGLQVGVAELYGVKNLLWSVSPVWRGEIGLDFSPVSFSTYVNMKNPKERSWKAVYTVGAKASAALTESFTLTAEVWGKAAEYLMDQWAMFSNRAVAIGITYRGGETK